MWMWRKQSKSACNIVCFSRNEGNYTIYFRDRVCVVRWFSVSLKTPCQISLQHQTFTFFCILICRFESLMWSMDICCLSVSDNFDLCINKTHIFRPAMEGLGLRWSLKMTFKEMWWRSKHLTIKRILKWFHQFTQISLILSTQMCAIHYVGPKQVYRQTIKHAVRQTHGLPFTGKPVTNLPLKIQLDSSWL